MEKVQRGLLWANNEGIVSQADVEQRFGNLLMEVFA
jgi:hypothetical protein